MNDEQRQIFALLWQAVHQIPLADEEGRMKLLRLVRVLADEVVLREGPSPKGGDPRLFAGLHAQHAGPGPEGDTPSIGSETWGAPGMRHCYECDACVSWLAPDGRCSCCTRVDVERRA